jgi:hypothetical protein
MKKINMKKKIKKIKEPKIVFMDFERIELYKRILAERKEFIEVQQEFLRRESTKINQKCEDGLNDSRRTEV